MLYFRHSGITQSIVNTVGNCAGFASPQIGSILLGDNKQNIENWRPVFYTAAVVVFVGGNALSGPCRGRPQIPTLDF